MDAGNRSLAEIDGELSLTIGAESTPRVVEWEVSEDYLFVPEWEFAYAISGHANIGQTQDGLSCVIDHIGDWSERGHFGVDFSQELIARETAVPGAATEWTVEPIAYFIEPGLPDSPERFLRDASGRVESIVLPNRYLVTTCEECAPVQVTVVHRFDRLD